MLTPKKNKVLNGCFNMRLLNIVRFNIAPIVYSFSYTYQYCSVTSSAVKFGVLLTDLDGLYSKKLSLTIVPLSFNSTVKGVQGFGV